MNWTEVLIFWLIVAVTVLSLKNMWLRFTVRILRDWQLKSMLGISRSLQGTPKKEEALEPDDVLDSDTIQ